MKPKSNKLEHLFDIPAPTGPNWCWNVRSIFKPVICLSVSLLLGFYHTLLQQAALFSSDTIVTVQWFYISEILAENRDYNIWKSYDEIT